MKLQSLRLAAGLAAAAGALAVTLPVAVAAQPSPQDAARQSCFRLSQMNNSRMADNNRVMYVRVYGNQFYRMDFTGSCNRSGNEPLVLRPVNDDLICHAIDVNVSVRGTHEGCIPTTLTRLTPAEVAAIPPQDRP
jgi:hypothetical protein